MPATIFNGTTTASAKQGDLMSDDITPTTGLAYSKRNCHGSEGVGDAHHL